MNISQLTESDWRQIIQQISMHQAVDSGLLKIWQNPGRVVTEQARAVVVNVNAHEVLFGVHQRSASATAAADPLGRNIRIRVRLQQRREGGNIRVQQIILDPE